mmetsp:Transcript_9834/g.34948  ORF Transcript_9834/g.34948 Transcript_9834/m.34948 type:complete len:149 (+) Transcript_9834:3232-3678(+)
MGVNQHFLMDGSMEALVVCISVGTDDQQERPLSPTFASRANETSLAPRRVTVQRKDLFRKATLVHRHDCPSAGSEVREQSAFECSNLFQVARPGSEAGGGSFPRETEEANYLRDRLPASCNSFVGKNAPQIINRRDRPSGQSSTNNLR